MRSVFAETRCVGGALMHDMHSMHSMHGMHGMNSMHSMLAGVRPTGFSVFGPMVRI